MFKTVPEFFDGFHKNKPRIKKGDEQNGRTRSEGGIYIEGGRYLAERESCDVTNHF